MKIFILIIRILAAVILITYGCSNLSKPSNALVALGLFEIIVALVILYNPAKSLIKQL